MVPQDASVLLSSHPDVVAVLPDADGSSDAIRTSVEHRLPLRLVAAALGRSDDPLWAAPLELERRREDERSATIAAVTAALGPLASAVALSNAGWRLACSRDVDLLVPAALLDEVAARLEVSLLPLPAWSGRDGCAFARIEYGSAIDLVDVAVVDAHSIAPLGEGLANLTTAAAVARVHRRVDAKGMRLADVIDLRLLGAQASVAGRVAPDEAAAVRPRHFDAPRRLAWTIRHPTPRIAFSGIDGSGKTTHVNALAQSLLRLNLPFVVLWNRPGFSELRVLDSIARPVKKLLRSDPRPVLQRRTPEADEQASQAVPVSRRGLVGWGWLLIITSEFIVRARGALLDQKATGGVVIFERHLLDAVVDIRWQYPRVRYRFHLFLLRHLLPGVAVTIRLVVPGSMATARKPDDVFGPADIAAHATLAEEVASLVTGALVIDTQQDLVENRERVLRAVLAATLGAPALEKRSGGNGDPP
jgi:hypothetical protein